MPEPMLLVPSERVLIETDGLFVPSHFTMPTMRSPAATPETRTEIVVPLASTLFPAPLTNVATSRAP